MASQQETVAVDYENFVHLTIGQLKDYLSLRRLNTSGNKAVLVSRAFVAAENNIKVKYSEEEQSKRISEEYQKRLSKLDICDPNNSPKQCAFTDDVRKWPKVDTGKIFEYILSNKDQEVDYIGKYKTEKAYSYFASNFVSKISQHSHEGKSILRGTVMPSFAVRDSQRKVWVAFDGDTIQGAWCTCIAGTAETCNHIIALLYKVEYASIMGFTDPACTSISCSWNKSSQNPITPMRVADMNIRQDNRMATEHNKSINPSVRKDFDPRRQDQRQVTNNNVTSLFSGIQNAIPGAVLFQGLPKVQSAKNLEPMSKIALDTRDENPQLGEVELCDKFLENLSQKCDLKMIEKKTRNQAASKTWYEQREGRLTASRHHEVYTKVNTVLRAKKVHKTTPLVAKLLGKEKDISHLPALQWGRDNEATARRKFMEVVALKHLCFTVKDCGLFVHPQHPYIAATPDGICTCKCNCCSDMVLEIKCPFSIRDKSVHESWGETDFLEQNGDEIVLKQSHKYYTQIQSQLALTKCRRGYFVVWTSVGEPIIQIVDIDSEFCSKVINNLVIFFKSYVAKYLLGLKELHFCPICDKLCLPPAEVALKKEESVFCKVCDQHYHLSCLQIPSTDESEYVCPGCDENN